MTVQLQFFLLSGFCASFHTEIVQLQAHFQCSPTGAAQFLLQVFRFACEFNWKNMYPITNVPSFHWLPNFQSKNSLGLSTSTFPCQANNSTRMISSFHSVLKVAFHLTIGIHKYAQIFQKNCLWTRKLLFQMWIAITTAQLLKTILNHSIKHYSMKLDIWKMTTTTLWVDWKRVHIGQSENPRYYKS